MQDTAVLVTVCDRPKHARSAFESIRKVRGGRLVLVVDDSSGTQHQVEHQAYAIEAGFSYIPIQGKRGLACALNIGLSFLLADRSLEWISYFQDDVEVDPDILEILRDVQHLKDRPLLTGHEAAEHKTIRRTNMNGIAVSFKDSCRATHMHAHRDYWTAVMPIPTRELGAPKRVAGQPRGIGSNVDWWVATWAPSSVKMLGRHVACVPGLVRTFAWKKQDSTWDNEQRAGEDAPLNRDAVAGWRRT